MSSPPPDYSTWSPEDLIKRVTALEAQLRAQNNLYKSSRSSSPTPKKIHRPFDSSKYTTRLIALKFAYLGAGYNGFEHHIGNRTPLPTIEEEIWKALVKCRLIFPPSLGGLDLGSARAQGLVCTDIADGEQEGMVEYMPVDWEGCGYSKCGRTDRGVSAFGQVIGIKVRSSKPMPKERESITNGDSFKGDLETLEINGTTDELPAPLEEVEEEEEEEQEWDPVQHEIPYIPLLNKVLPPTIRILAWCPTPPPTFDARFSCKERQYRYFFTSPAFLPAPGPAGLQKNMQREGFLDIEAMQKACDYLVGSHDFRNFCKIDPSKQLDTFNRRITSASIDKIQEESSPAFTHTSAFRLGSGDARGKAGLYAFTVRGSAFLWHQVRNMIAILFLVGQGLESPALVKQLLDAESISRKPKYEMASDKPLVLWDTFFTTSEGQGKFEPGEKPDGYIERGLGDDELEWVYAGEEVGGKSGKWGGNSIMEQLWSEWRSRKMDEVLAAQLMDMIASQGPAADAVEQKNGQGMKGKMKGGGQRVFEGDDIAKSRGKYIPVLEKERMDEVEAINARYLERKGYLERKQGKIGKGKQ
ncbi:pseudouridine synthase [Venturia nashicola]|nr:pseudouridine synthase [Venturia nashicola]